jgi:hypothetical protein
MNWKIFAVFLSAAVVACAQSSGQNRASKSQPEQEQALDNALQGANASNRFSGPFTTSPPRTVPVVTSSTHQPVRTCATPLLAIPFDPDVDSGIHRELKPDTLNADRMLTLKTLPICSRDNRSAR